MLARARPGLSFYSTGWVLPIGQWTEGSRSSRTAQRYFLCSVSIGTTPRTSVINEQVDRLREEGVLLSVCERIHDSEPIFEQLFVLEILRIQRLTVGQQCRSHDH